MEKKKIAAEQEVYLSPPDARDYEIAMAMDVSDTVIPERFRLCMPEAELQQAGNCVAQANSTRVEYNIGTGEQVSVGWLYGNRRETRHRGSGLVVRDAMKTVVKYGNLLREHFEYFYEVPYAIDRFEQAYDSVKDKAFFDKSYIRLHTKEDVQRFALKYNTPVLGVLHTGDLSGTLGEGGLHCVLICGWKPVGECIEEDTFYRSSRQDDMIFHNSWGRLWQFNGYGTCRFEIFKEIWGIVPMAEKFTDISGHWAESAIKQAADDGILKGYEDGSFRPDQPLTRAELAAIYQRMKAALK